VQCQCDVWHGTNGAICRFQAGRCERRRIVPFFGGWLRKFGSEVPARATRNASVAALSAVPIKVKPAGAR
jgi:hypothetical protein